MSDGNSVAAFNTVEASVPQVAGGWRTAWVYAEMPTKGTSEHRNIEHRGRTSGSRTSGSGLTFGHELSTIFLNNGNSFLTDI